jgi:micrococcal nuclease
VQTLPKRIILKSPSRQIKPTFSHREWRRKEVKPEYDRQRKDRHGRVLAYVYLLDGTFLNAEIIKQGYGFAYTKYPFKFLDEFRGYEREARETKRGLWR